MSGGVSLAVWMGGVAREVNLLTQASDLRVRADDEVPVPPPAAPQDGSLALRVRDLYGQLLDLVDVTASVDVLSGTSAGGVNAAVLGLANARRLDHRGCCVTCGCRPACSMSCSVIRRLTRTRRRC